MKAMFNHLHLHSEYSLLDGIAKIKDLVPRAKELGFKAIALTDHGNLHGSYEFWKLCKENDIKPIIGCELYLAPRSRHDKVHKIDDKPYHLTVLAKNQKGYQNLIKLVSLAHLEGFYRFPRVDKELLEQYHEGLIVLSGCMSGIVSKHLLQDNWADAEKEAKWFRKVFGDDYFLELQRFEKQESIDLSNKIIELSKVTGIPLATSADVHYISNDDWEVQEVVWAVYDGKTLSDLHRRRAWTKELYLKSADELVERFKDVPEAIENTQKIVDSIEFVNMEYERVQPIYKDIPKGKTAKSVLSEKAYKGAKNRYGKLTKDLKERVDFELKIIDDKGYNHYFLVVGDIMQWSREHDIVVSCRGSVAGSVVAYSLGITNIDPIVWELYFERFLNPERNSPPDVDMDLQDDARDQVIKYIEEKYGKENITAICTFGRLKSKAAIRDVARVMEIDLSIADKLSKMVQVLFGKTKSIDFMLENDSEFKSIIESDPKLMKLAEYVRKIEVNARHISVHACGYLITPEPVMNYVPLRRESKGGERIITHHEFVPLEKMGLMKFDFLGLANLTIIKNAIEKVRKKLGNNDYKVEDIPFDDKKTYELLTRGNTHGIFQVESEGMRKYLRKLKPQNMEDICFMLAAYRPGPMQYIDPYINRKYGREKVEYLIPEMEPIVQKTYGFAIYQEQVIRIAVDIAGYTMGQADELRRAMGKKIKEVMDAEEPKFKAGVLKKGFNQKIADQLWEYMLPFADYGFNKAHSASYAVVTYWTAYLKAHFPLEYMAALLEHHLQNVDEVRDDINECERMGIEVLPPDVNKSDVNFTIEEGKAIRLGLAAIKNVGTKPCEEIVKTRNDGNGEFKSLEDCFQRLNLHNINKKTIEFLIKVGAFDSLADRAVSLQLLAGLYDSHAKLQKEKEGGQTGMFEVGLGLESGHNGVNVTFTGIPLATDAQKLAWEKELLGVYITQHPLKEIAEFMDVINAVDVGSLTIDFDGKIIKTVALISSLKRTVTKKDNKSMAILTLEGLNGKIPAVIFPRTYEQSGNEIDEGDIVYVKGTVTDREGSPNLLINEIKKIDVDKAIQFAQKRRKGGDEQATEPAAKQD